jgi:hypothetical protein
VMNLRGEIVEDADFVSSFQQCIRSMGTDETRAACNKNPFRHHLTLAPDEDH